MDDKEAATVLIRLLETYPLTDKEREAVERGIGILSWTLLAKSQIKLRKAKRDQAAQR